MKLKPTRTIAPMVALVIVAFAASVSAAEPEPRAPLFPADFEGSTIALVYLDLRDPAGNTTDATYTIIIAEPPTLPASGSTTAPLVGTALALALMGAFLRLVAARAPGDAGNAAPAEGRW